MKRPLAAVPGTATEPVRERALRSSANRYNESLRIRPELTLCFLDSVQDIQV